MKRRLFVLGIIVFLSGCWDRYELEERANILGIAIDIATEEDMGEEPEVTHQKGDFPGQDDNLIKLTAQISLPGKIKLGPEGGGGEGSEKNSWVLETVGHSVKDAITNLQQQLAEKLYLGHLQIIVISEDVAENGIEEINDYFRRNPEVRRTAWMIVNKNDAKKVLEAAPPVENVPSLYLSDTLDNAVRFGKLPREYLGMFWIDLSNPGVDATLPRVRVINNDRILIDGMAYFKGNKMINKFSPIEIGMYMALKGMNPAGYSVPISLPNEEGVYMVKAVGRDSKIKSKIEKGKPTTTFEVNIDAMIEEEIESNQLDLSTIQEIEDAASKRVNKMANNFIRQLQEDQSDIFGLGARIRAKYPNYWDKHVKTDEKWAEIYKDMDIEIDYNISIRRTGMEWK